MIAQAASHSWSELLTFNLAAKSQLAVRPSLIGVCVRNVSNRAQNRQPYPVTVAMKVKWMKAVFAFFSKLLMGLKGQSEQFQTQRMCPFCGLITPRAKRSCLECGKPLNPAPPKVKEAKQEG